MTPEEIMTMVANEHSYETWYELMYDSHAHWQIVCTKEAMERYAEQKLQQHGVVRGGVNVASTVSIPYDYNNTVTVAKPPSTPTEPLPAEGQARQTKSAGFYCIDKHGKCEVQCKFCKCCECA